MKENYKKLILISSIGYVASGIFAPAWYIFLSQRADPLKFGLLLGITAIAGGLATYFTGKFSDKYDKSLILTLSYLLLALTSVSFIFVESILAICSIQFIFGIASSIVILMENILVSINTEEHQRGLGMGLFSGVQQVIIGVCMIIGGWIAIVTNIDRVFLLAAILLFICSAISTKIQNKI